MKTFSLFCESADIEQTIIDNPSDVSAKLVYADWLEEHGKFWASSIIRNLDTAKFKLNEMSTDSTGEWFETRVMDAYTFEELINHLKVEKYTHMQVIINGKKDSLLSHKDGPYCNVTIFWWGDNMWRKARLSEFPEVERIVFRSGGIK